MDQFKITIFDRKNKYIKNIFPDHIEKEERLKLKEYLNKNGCKIYCSCTSAIEFMIDSALRFRPKTLNKSHDEFCAKYHEKNCNSQEYNSGFKINKDNHYIKARINTLRRPKTREFTPSINRSDRIYPKVNYAKIPNCALIKKINMVTFEKRAFLSSNFIKQSENRYLPFSDMRNKAYGVIKNTTVNNNSLLSQNTTDYEFFYEVLANHTEETKNIRFYNKNLNKLVNKDVTVHTLYSNRIDKNKNNIKFYVYDNYFKKAFTEFKNTYGFNNLENKNIIFSGFKDSKGIYDLHFIYVNDFGLHCDSSYENKMYNYICNLLNSDQYKNKGIHFYKPYEYGYGAYGDSYLEDGIIEFDNSEKKIIIEVYGLTNDIYRNKIKLKEDILKKYPNKFIYIPWDAANGEPIPENELVNSIDNLLKTKN